MFLKYGLVSIWCIYDLTVKIQEWQKCFAYDVKFRATVTSHPRCPRATKFFFFLFESPFISKLYKYIQQMA
jgi:hypothetical protein